MCWSEKIELSGDRRKALKDSRVMISVALSTFVEYFIKIVERSEESRVDFYTQKVSPTPFFLFCAILKENPYLLLFMHELFKHPKIKLRCCSELVIKSIDFRPTFE